MEHTVTQQPNVIKMISFNLKRDFGPSLRNDHKWSERKGLAAQVIRESGAQIIGVQELLPDMRDDVTRMLDVDYSILGLGRFSGKKPKDDEHSDIIIKNNCVDVNTVKTFWLSKHPERISRAFFAIFPRICTVAEVYLKESDRTIRVFNTHLDHISGIARVLGIQVILQYMISFNKQKKLPTVLMGDFNCKPNSRPIQLLRDHVLAYPGLRLTDAYSVMNPQEINNTLHNFSGKIRKGAQPIDYIFLSDDFEILDASIMTDPTNGRYPSDHYPLMATVRLRD